MLQYFAMILICFLPITTGTTTVETIAATKTTPIVVAAATPIAVAIRATAAKTTSREDDPAATRAITPIIITATNRITTSIIGATR